MPLPLLIVVEVDSSFEGDRECVKGCLPAGDPACSSSAGWVEASDREVQAFHGGLLVREVAARPHGATEASVQTLDLLCQAVISSSTASVIREIVSFDTSAP